MAIIKKPIRKILLYLVFFAGAISVLMIKLIAGDSQNNLNLSNLEKKAKEVFLVATGLAPLAKGQGECWTAPPSPPESCVDVGCGCEGGGTPGGSSGVGTCSCW